MTTVPELLQFGLGALGGNFNDNLVNLLNNQIVGMKKIWRPNSDMFETDKYIHIVIDLPGVDSDSIDISVFNNHIKVNGERKQADVNKSLVRFINKEIIYGKFESKFTMPICISKKDSVTITRNNGTLLITVDKTNESNNKFTLKVEP
tara:strand:+ start:10989 stop:11432 length:444 start_codon:yes stop_codon:yes gene_type:complete